jgi:hypothetical protein
MQYDWQPDDVASAQWNVLMGSTLNERMKMVGLRAIEADRIHKNRQESRYKKLRAEKEKALPKGFSFTPPPDFNFNQPFKLPEDFSLWPMPPES